MENCVLYQWLQYQFWQNAFISFRRYQELYVKNLAVAEFLYLAIGFQDPDFILEHDLVIYAVKAVSHEEYQVPYPVLQAIQLALLGEASEAG